MSRLTTGTLRLTLEPLSLDAILRAAAEVVQPAADARQIWLDVQAPPDAGPIIGDSIRLHQVCWNLLTNAVKYTPAGGMVTVTLRHDADHAVIEVRDTGVGIAPSFLPFVFEPFRQAQGRETRGDAGLGLGLAIARQLVELHGGTIAASSPGLDQGATFVVRLPLRRA
jgi:two-component system CheB/CheR fusion protein